MESYVKHQLSIGSYTILTELPLRVLLSFDYNDLSNRADIVDILISRCTRERVVHHFDWSVCTIPLDEYIKSAALPVDFLSDVPTTLCSSSVIAWRYIAEDRYPDYNTYIRWKFHRDDEFPREFNLYLENMELRFRNDELSANVDQLRKKLVWVEDMFRYYVGGEEYQVACDEYKSYLNEQ